MESKKETKRKKETHSEDDAYRRDRKSKRGRSQQRSPSDSYKNESRRKRRHSKSVSPTVPPKQEKQESQKQSVVKKDIPGKRAKDTDMLNTRTGGAYIPPARLRMMQAQITDKSSVAYQRLAWEALKKSIHGHINKINVGNIGIIIKELLKENIVRGRGLLCRSVIQAQAASPTFTNVYAALVSAVNSRFPNIGELLLKRLVIQFKRGFKRNDKSICISSASFIAHLVNQRVAHEILALELLTLLVETPTDDSVEVAIAFLKECGQKLTEVSSKGVNAIFEMLRNILHEGQLDKRVQYMIEVMFQVWKDGFKDHPALIEELELVPEEEQFTHLLMLDDATDPQDILNVFKFDEKYEDNEQKYKTLSKEILGSDAESGGEEGSGESGSEEEDDEENEEQKPVTIIDNTETNLIALRRTIYLTINSSLDFEECAHKLMKMQLKPGQEAELCHMFLDCCAEQRTYEKFYGLLAQRFCNINRIYIGPFEEIFKDSYSTAHRLDTNRLRNVSKFFAHLLFTDSISWEVLECVRLNEEDTTSSSRIYIKILFQELAEYMGLKKLNDRLQDPTLQQAFSGVFPRDNPKNTRFSINFFTSIGLGGLTDELREHLKQMPKNVPAPITEINLETSSSDSSSSSSSDSSSSDSSSSESDDSDEEGKKKTQKEKAKSNTKKDKEKASNSVEVSKENDKGERWGHDGFYDTYGKDAQRLEPRNDRKENDNFAKPRERGNNYKEQSAKESERNNDRNQDRRHPGRSNDVNREESRRRLDDGESERNNRRRDDGERQKNERDRNRQREDRDDRSRREEPRRPHNSSDRRRTDDDKSRREQTNRHMDSESRRKNDDGKQFERDRNKRDNEQGKETSNRNQREERYQGREEIKKNSHSTDKVESSYWNTRPDNGRDKESRNRPDENDRNNKDNRRRRDDREPLDSKYEKEKQGKDRNTNKEQTQSNKKGDDLSERKDKTPPTQSRKKDKQHSRDVSDDKDDQKKNDTKKKENRKSKKSESSSEDSSSEEDSSPERHKKKTKKGSRNEINKESRDKSRSKNKKRNRESSSDEESTSDDDTSASDDETSKRKDKNSNRLINNKDGWDIAKAGSVRKEFVGRYWDNHNL